MAINLLTKKLQMKSGQRVLLLNAPLGYLKNLEPLPEGVDPVSTPDGEFDFVQLFVKNLEELAEALPIALQAIKYDALFWIAYPKGGSKAGTDLHRDTLSQAVSEHNFSSVTLVSLDETWSAMRFRPTEQVGQ
ncbi:hypothetical protein [Tengunoibacter tsumagoiensis]|uniref:DUF3052 domain-containing protein n=1 Tax=Tengunoibacter tsumagoiensis TaxID=2014871 RepID=A0A402A0Q3_9CHLR|nr:hypothetical protein [Tengunoibacter tsumagoiensis]GCE12639.1 hypothetical protein KTT_24980 [Tengunoibacter tsumagoiensis]